MIQDRRVGGNTGDNSADYELVPRQVLCATVRFWKGFKEGDIGRTPGMEVIWMTVPIVTKEAPKTCDCRSLTRGSQERRTDVHTPSPPNPVSVE